jgi:hypothetical protein
MITIEHLQILFDAEREADEAVFARLFRQHAAQLEATRRSEQEDAAQSADDRSLRSRRSW